MIGRVAEKPFRSERYFTCGAPQAPWSEVAPATVFLGSRCKHITAAV